MISPEIPSNGIARRNWLRHFSLYLYAPGEQKQQHSRWNSYFRHVKQQWSLRQMRIGFYLPESCIGDYIRFAGGIFNFVCVYPKTCPPLVVGNWCCVQFDHLHIMYQSSTAATLGASAWLIIWEWLSSECSVENELMQCETWLLI